MRNRQVLTVQEITEKLAQGLAQHIGWTSQGNRPIYRVGDAIFEQGMNGPQFYYETDGAETVPLATVTLRFI